MSNVAQCSQKGCAEPAVGRYTWPGKDEAGICATHKPKLQAIANAMGLYLQVIDLEPRGIDEPYPWESPR